MDFVGVSGGNLRWRHIVEDKDPFAKEEMLLGQKDKLSFQSRVYLSIKERKIVII